MCVGQPVDAGRRAAEQRFLVLGRNRRDDFSRRLPDSIVVAVEERDRPVAAAHQTVAAERLERDRRRRNEVRGRPVGASERGVQPRELRVDVRGRGARSEPAFPVAEVAAPERRLPEMVDDQHEVREAIRKARDIVEVVRVDDRELQQHPGLLEQLERLEDRRPHDPVRVGLVVDQVPDGAHLRPTFELLEPLAGPRRIVELQPHGHGRDPRPARGLQAEVVGVGVETCALNEHDGVHTVAIE